MKSFFAALAGVASAQTMDPLLYTFMQHINKFDLKYETMEMFEMRFSQFKKAHQEIEEHNASGANFTMGHNQFSTWTQKEFDSIMGFLNIDRVATEYAEFEPTNADSVDWVAAGAVTEVKNQGSCGSCWSFSTTGSMEGAHFIATGNLVSLSEENLVACAHNGNLGCMGGMMDRAFKWTESNPLETEDDYPYNGWLGSTSCKYDSSKGVVGATSYVDVTPSSSEALKAQLVKGPVSVAIQANQRVFQRYTSGIIMASDGCGTSLDHGVLAVGYGTSDEGVEYYTVKNSWGASWGESGYVRLEVVDGDGVCGIQIQPSQPTTN